MTSEIPMLDELKRRYFQLASRERMGRTPRETEKLDRLQDAIRELSSPTPPREMIIVKSETHTSSNQGIKAIIFQ